MERVVICGEDNATTRGASGKRSQALSDPTGYEPIAVFSAGTPIGRTGIGCVQVTPRHVEVTARKPGPGIVQEGANLDTLILTAGSECETGGFNRTDRWRLRQIADGHAVFDVRSRFYSCTDPLAQEFGIPSRRTRGMVIICSGAGGAEDGKALQTNVPRAEPGKLKRARARESK
jgi:hypothetical protein